MQWKIRKKSVSFEKRRRDNLESPAPRESARWAFPARENAQRSCNDGEKPTARLRCLASMGSGHSGGGAAPSPDGAAAPFAGRERTRNLVAHRKIR